MVQVVEMNEHVGEAASIEFKVYRSPTDPDLILGRWQHAASVPNGQKGMIAIASEKLGTPVDIEFQRVMTYADQQGIPFVWVNDAHGLFPPFQRPSYLEEGPVGVERVNLQ